MYEGLKALSRDKGSFVKYLGCLVRLEEIKRTSTGCLLLSNSQDGSLLNNLENNTIVIHCSYA